MSIITEPIGPGAFEIVRDRIAAILMTEIPAQYAMGYEDWMNVKRIYLSRFVPFNESELNCINVGVGKGDLDGHDVTQTNGTYTFWIDVHTGAKSTTQDDGSSKATHEMHALVSLVRSIIEHSEYKTLGFVPPFVMYRRFNQMLFNPPEHRDEYSVSVGRLQLLVKVPEVNGLYLPRTMEGYETTVKLHESDRGYYYFGQPEDVPPAPEGLDITLNATL